MPVYKNVPSPRKSEDLPLYRPIDHWVATAWQKRGVLAPFLILGALVLLAAVGYRAYASRMESTAAQLVDRGQLETAARDYPRSAAARLARMKLGKQALDAGEWDKAIQWYGPVADSAKSPVVLRIAAAQNLALAHIKKGDAARAVALLERAAKDPANRSADYTNLLLARAHEAKGDVASAQGLYQSLSEGASEASVKGEAKERLTWIEKGNSPQ